MSTVRQRDGVCRAYTKDGSSYCFKRECYEQLLRDWMSGKAFFAGVGPFGEPVTVKLATVEGVADFSPEMVAAQEEDEAEAKKQEMLNGDG
jgi:hypothetical protein